VSIGEKAIAKECLKRNKWWFEKMNDDQRKHLEKALSKR
jgi:hypothetical protein